MFLKYVMNCKVLRLACVM